MTTTTVFRTAWAADNVQISDERGRLNGHYSAMLWAERFNKMKRGCFLIGTVSVQFTKGEGYRIILKDANENRVIDETVKDCPAALTSVAWPRSGSPTTSPEASSPTASAAALNSDPNRPAPAPTAGRRANP